MTDAKNMFATVMLYFVAFAVYFKVVRGLVTGSSLDKYAGLLGANLNGALFSKLSEINSR